ncbi:MAG: hypothetical protein MZV64_33945 [Ignavibacteriales bacterium]|nr:hypothetical protein [Ignavibacteriales bacterium]
MTGRLPRRQRAGQDAASSTCATPPTSSRSAASPTPARTAAGSDRSVRCDVGAPPPGLTGGRGVLDATTGPPGPPAFGGTVADGADAAT